MTTLSIGGTAVTATPAQLNYVAGVTSAIQTQLNTKEPTISAGTTAQYLRGDKSWQTLPSVTDTWITTQTCSTDYALQSVGKTTKTCINKVDYSDVAYDVSCTNCLTNVEVASSDTASDLTCTDCIGPTEITDSYVLNTTDSMSGNLTVGGDLTVTGASTNFRNAIKAVDGSGSLIDADMVDGQHASDLGGTLSCYTVITRCDNSSDCTCTCGESYTVTGGGGYTSLTSCDRPYMSIPEHATNNWRIKLGTACLNLYCFARCCRII